MPEARGGAASIAASGSEFAAGSEAAPAAEPRKRISRDDAAWKRRIEEALRVSAGNIAAAARSLGLHRTQLRRLIERHGIAVVASAADAPGADSDAAK
jgi:transcriptional regulator with GAF, ATPase, and Fis domain